MCGLAGFAGITSGDDAMTKFMLTLALGAEIDDRGGHGIGHVTVNGNVIDLWKDMDDWKDVEFKFVRRASKGDLTMLHSRFATCGQKTTRDAHPFAIERNGRVVLYGMHNGMIDNARDSAKKHGREFTVDSLELLELLADGRFDEIEKLEGYGTLVWVRADDTKTVRMVRMTDHADLYVCQVKEGGYVYGSTGRIVNDALKKCDLTSALNYQIDVGQVYGLRTDGFFKMTNEKVTLADRWTVELGRLTSGKAKGLTNIADWRNVAAGAKRKHDTHTSYERLDDSAVREHDKRDVVERLVNREIDYESFEEWYEKQDEIRKAVIDDALFSDDDDVDDEANEYYDRAADEYIDTLTGAELYAIAQHGQIDALAEQALRKEHGGAYDEIKDRIVTIVTDTFFGSVDRTGE